MKRRNFIQTAVLGSAFLATNSLFAFQKIAGAGEGPQSLIDPIVPFRYYRNRKDEMISQLIDMRQRFGLRRFSLVAPMEEVRLTGYPSRQVYQEIGEDVLYVKNKLASYDIEIGWWSAPSLRLGAGGDFQYITDLNGTISDTSPCPLDPKFKEDFSNNIAHVVKIARPFIVHFEDDFELSWQPKAVKFGCFCPHHLAEFSKRQGQNYSREELEKIFTDKVTPHSIKLRRAWAELSRDSLTSLAEVIREKVDIIAPETRMLLCQSGICDMDGDFTEAVTKAFAGKTRPAVRLFGSDYSSDEAQSLPKRVFHALYSIQHLPKEFEFYHESDTYPHTRFFMSATKLKSLMTAAFSYGFDTSMFYGTQYLDNPLEEEGYVSMFHSEIKRFSALKEAVKNCEVGGVEIVHRSLGYIANSYERRRGHDNYTGQDWVPFIGKSGIPYTSKNGKVKIVAGNFVDILTDDEIKEMLSGGVLLDGSAAYSLYKRGWGEMIGADVAKGSEANFSYEGVRNPDDYPNIKGKLMYNLLFAPAGSEGGSFYELKPKQKAKIITDFLDPEEKPVIPGMLRFKNKLGGRVVITAFSIAGNRSSAVFNYKKKEIIRQSIEWLGNEPLPVFVNKLPNVYCIFNRSKSDDFAIVTLINLSADPANSFSLDVAPEWVNVKVKMLNENGKWQEVNIETKGRTMKVDLPLLIMQPVILKFT